MNLERETFVLDHVLEQFFFQSRCLADGATSLSEAVSDDNGLPLICDLKYIKEEMKRLGMMLCGGAVNSIFMRRTIKDLDFYLEDISKREDAIAFLSKFFTKAFTSDNAITFSRNSMRSRKKWVVQLITRFSGQPKEIFEYFDFTITHGAFKYSTNTFEFGDRFFQDLSKRELVYAGKSLYPICAMYRLKKYTERGFYVSGATIMHISLCIVQLKISSYRELKMQLMGIDTMYLQKLLEAKQPDAPVDYGEFIYEAFQLIEGVGKTLAEIDDEDEEESSYM